ncbi:DUF7344 domain-containing protein [Halegenticoccus tardaugens]|uniref:DUF7344 domain-containing protein n=1 Tax=Halegenticoccus tardaugens TaxID=2071624 RepID=UPI001E351CBA|nr:hypothetical protein [Halegenticoccus tardaugens]
MSSDGASEEPAEMTDDGALESTEIHDVLRNARRRRVLERLNESGGSETVRELSEHVAGIEAGETPPPRNVRQSVYVSLHQTHLPKLDDLGIVSYDSDAKEVALAQHADEVTVYLEVVPKYGISWGEYYLGLGLLGLLVLLAESFGVPVIGGIDPTVLSGGFFSLIIVSSAYHITTQQCSLFHRLRGR